MPSPTIADLIDTLATLSATRQPGTEDALRQATMALIAAMRRDGQLAENPMTPALSRTVVLHEAEVAARLRGRRVLVTGGSGCIGTALRRLIAGFGPAALVNLDIAPHHGPGTGLVADIRDPAALRAAFARARPEVVFHLASVREPARAELVVREAVETNVFGTANVIEACRAQGVEHAVYSSTGKCFAYLTDHVYTGSKKLAEAQWMAAAREARGPTRFAMTRFTHVLENGVIARDIAEGIAAGMVGLHGPNRHFNIQNLRQATHLLLNALALSGSQAPASFWSAVDLGWPVNTLELALFEIAARAEGGAGGRPVGVRFLGVPDGYDESFFRGQFDWSGEHDYHPLINALEATTAFADSTGSMTGAVVAECPPAALRQALDTLSAAIAAGLPGSALKRALLEAVAQVTEATFRQICPHRLLDILWWGAAPCWVGRPDQAARHRPVMALLARLLLPAPGQPDRAPDWSPGPADRAKLQDIAESFGRIPGLEEWAPRLRELARPPRAA